MGMLNTERNSRMNLRLEDSPEEISSHDHSTFRNPFIEGQMWVDSSPRYLACIDHQNSRISRGTEL